MSTERIAAATNIAMISGTFQLRSLVKGRLQCMQLGSDEGLRR